MKKETIIAAIVFFGAGFLAGYVYDNQKRSEARFGLANRADPATRDEGQQNAAPVGEAQSQSRAAGSAGGLTLPEGHPPVGTAAGTNDSTAENPAGLPEGHPPVDVDAVSAQLKDEAAKRPQDPEARLKLANFLYDQKRYDGAIEWYKKALELDPKNVSARTDLGTAYFYTGRPDDAVKEYRRSLQTDPEHQPTLFNLVVVSLDGTHDVAAAQQALDRLEKLNPSYPQLDSLKHRMEAARSRVRGSAMAGRGAGAGRD